jgi:hypothetical protein
MQVAEQAPEGASSQGQVVVVKKEGFVKKRAGRMHQWTSRYFVLTNSSLAYKIKQDSRDFRNQYELTAGCVVTEVMDENKGSGGRIKFSFWVVWPKIGKHEEKNEDSEEEDEHEGHVGQAPQAGATPMHNTHNTPHKNTGADSGTGPASGTVVPTARDLQHIVRNEVSTQKRLAKKAEEQLEVHTNHDSSVSNGALVGAVVVGGVVVGALTMGIGLIPYFTIVGVAAAVSGGAVVANSRRRPSNSRIIMAFDTNKEAIEWKAAIEAQVGPTYLYTYIHIHLHTPYLHTPYLIHTLSHTHTYIHTYIHTHANIHTHTHTPQVRTLAERARPTLPDSVNAKTIAAILDLSSVCSAWRRVGVAEGLCVLEYTTLHKAAQNYHPVMDLQDTGAAYEWWLTLGTY